MRIMAILGKLIVMLFTIYKQTKKNSTMIQKHDKVWSREGHGRRMGDCQEPKQTAGAWGRRQWYPSGENHDSDGDDDGDSHDGDGDDDDVDYQ